MTTTANKPPTISVVTPTLRRPAEMIELLENLRRQTLLPLEWIIVDGAPPEELETETTLKPRLPELPFVCRYFRHGGGTAVQRNFGIAAATSEFIALIDDDIRMEPDFLALLATVLINDPDGTVGGVTGCISNQRVEPQTSLRWRWYRTLRLLTTYEPGRYDYQTGIPVNRYLQAPHQGLRELDFMGAGCALWRRRVFDAGLRFDLFFRDYGMLEDAHLALRARRQWKLLECGAARCVHLQSPGGRVNRRRIGYKCVVNYYYVFQDIVNPLPWRARWRFWRYQAFELFRLFTSALRRRRWADWQEVQGRLEGIYAVARGSYKG